MSFEQQNSVKTFYVNIHLAGDYDTCIRKCREIAYTFGFCFQVHAVDYVYTGGAEDGVMIRVINYPRFPRNEEEIKNLCIQFGSQLATEMCQKSFTIETSTDTMYFESTHPLHSK